MDIRVTHLSTACVLLEIGRVRILTDPVVDTVVEEHRVAPGVYFSRFPGPSQPASSVGQLDAALLSHPHHADDLDGLGREVLVGAREVIVPFEELDPLPGRRVTGLRPWSSTNLFGRGGKKITVTATPALHGPVWLPNARLKFDARHVRGYLLEWDGQEHGALYISGDTIYRQDLRKLAIKKIGNAILHLGGVNLWPPVPPLIHYPFNGREAARLARSLGRSLHTIIPVHYEQGVRSHFKEDLASYPREIAEADLTDQVRWLTKGEPTCLAV